MWRNYVTNFWVYFGLFNHCELWDRSTFDLFFQFLRKFVIIHGIIWITDKVQTFDFELGVWHQMPLYPFPIVLPTVVWVPTEKRMFVFGGYGYYFAWKTSNIYKCLKSKKDEWSYVGSMSYSSSNPLVLPYMNKVVMK